MEKWENDNNPEKDKSEKFEIGIICFDSCQYQDNDFLEPKSQGYQPTDNRYPPETHFEESFFRNELYSRHDSASLIFSTKYSHVSCYSSHMRSFFQIVYFILQFNHHLFCSSSLLSFSIVHSAGLSRAKNI